MKQSLKIADMPLDERPRERLNKFGVKALSNAELLAIILRTGTKGENVLDLSKRLFNDYNIKSLARTRANRLKQVFGIGQAKACQIIAAFELGKRLAGFSGGRKLKIEKAKDVAKFLMPELCNLKKEHLVGVYLDSRKKVITQETIFVGSLNANIVHPREIFAAALAESAAAIILVHNHPSGDPMPSDDDITVTKQLIKAGKILGVEVLDHIIIGNKRHISLREERICDFS